jgi:hypothetical protein
VEKANFEASGIFKTQMSQEFYKKATLIRAWNFTDPEREMFVQHWKI